MTDERFKAACDELSGTLALIREWNETDTSTLVDVDFLLELLARLGGRIFFRQDKLAKEIEHAWSAWETSKRDGFASVAAFQYGVANGLQHAESIMREP